MSSSSGRSAKRPHAAFKLTLEVSALPDGFTPSGCLLVRELRSSPPVIGLDVEAAASVFTLFDALESAWCSLHSSTADG